VDAQSFLAQFREKRVGILHVAVDVHPDRPHVLMPQNVCM
jgi:hypothetical protein